MNFCELDYYAILNVPRTAKKEEITLAYRKLAIRLHPFKDPKHQEEFLPLCQKKQLSFMDPLDAKIQWSYINMAFDILGNDLRRSIYDRYGEAGLLKGVLLPNGYFPPYQYHGDDMLVYQSVFGSYSPYSNLIDAITNPPPLSKNINLGIRKKEKPIERIVELTLEEVYNGCIKIMQVWRQDFVDKEETRTEKRQHNLTLNIEPGVTAGTRYCFKEEGDRSPTSIPADIIFIIADKPHKCFRRQDHHNLVHTYEIDLCQALTGYEFIIYTLDRRQLKVLVNDIVKPGYKKVLHGEGLPKCKDNSAVCGLKPKEFEKTEYGDIIIEFKTIFPNYLSKEMKKHIRNLFSQLNIMGNDELE